MNGRIPMNGRTEVYKAKVWSAVPWPEHPGYWHISEDGKPGQGPCFKGETAEAEAKRFAARLNLSESTEPAFGRD